MTAVSVSAQNTRLDDAETTTDWGIIGGGPAGGLEPDYKYQGSNCRSRKGATALRGIFLSDNVDSDLSGAGTYETVMFKFICTTPGLLDLLSVPGLALRVGSGSTIAAASSDYHFYDVEGSDTYPIDKSWLILPIDPNIASHRSGTVGTPGLTVVDFYALMNDQIGVSKAENYALDAVDIGAGLTLIGGDGADPDGVWQDLSDADWGTTANRYGYVRENEGVFLVYGKLIIGTATATVFNDSQETIIFPEGLFAAGFSGVQVDLANATTDIDFVTTIFLGGGTEAGEDTRPIFTVLGTTGVFDADRCTWDNHATLTLTSAATLLACTISNSEKIVQAGGTIDGCTLFGATTADGVAFIVSNNPSNIKNSSFTFSDGHAIEITATGTYNIDANTFTGYGLDDTNDASIFNNSGGAVTLNVINGSTGITVRNGASASTTVNNSVTLSLTGIQTDSEVRIINLDDVINFNKELDGTEQVSGLVQSAILADAGTSYIATDVLTILGGTGTAATITVDTVDGGGEILTFTITTPGSYTANPPTPASVTGGAGSGAQFRLNISGTFDFTYDAGLGVNVAIIVFHLDFKEIRIEQVLPASNSSIPIQQSTDRVFNNP